MKVHCLVFEGFSDWEPAFVLPELRKNSVEVVAVGFSETPIKSMGGMHITPDKSLYALDPSEIKTLIIPGGTLWEKEVPPAFISLLKKLRSQSTLIAAICGGTIPLANAGLLDSAKHTSNDLNYLKAMVQDYRGESNYVNELAIHDQNLITASGIGAIEFARELLLALKVYDTDKVETWFKLFKYGEWS